MAPEVVAVGYARLADLGLSVVEAAQCRRRHGHAAGTPEERAQAIHAFLLDPNVHGLISFWGGYQSHQVLEHLDFGLVAANLKPIIGYSDVTALTIGCYARAGVVTFSGPAVISFAKPTLPEYTQSYLKAVLMDGTSPLEMSASKQFSDNPWFSDLEKLMRFEPTPPWTALKGGLARGPLIACNIGTMLLLQGTPFWPDLDGAILVVEEDEVESPGTIDRFFTQLRQIGAFDRVAALVVGRLPRCVGFTPHDKLEDIITYTTRGYKFPILINIDYGHTDPLLTLPIGVDAEVDADQATLRLLESAVKMS